MRDGVVFGAFRTADSVRCRGRRTVPEAAFAIFRSNYKKYPNQWFVHSGMARVYTAQGDYDNAVKEMKLAMASAPDNTKSALQGLVKRLENKEDINK